MKSRTAVTRLGFVAAGIVMAASAFGRQTQPRVVKDVEYARAGDI